MTKTLKVVSDFEPAGSQPEAINNLVSGLEDGLLHQTLRDPEPTFLFTLTSKF